MGLFTYFITQRTEVPLSRKRLQNHTHTQKKSADALRHSRQKTKTSKVPLLNYEMV